MRAERRLVRVARQALDADSSAHREKLRYGAILSAEFERDGRLTERAKAVKKAKEEEASRRRRNENVVDV